MSNRFDRVKDEVRRQATVKALEMENNSLILVRFKKWFSVAEINEIAEVVQELAAKFPEVTFLIGDKLDFEAMNEKQMNNKGWYRK